MWIDQRDLAWCAGFYEGEGNISFQLQSHRLKDGTDGRPFRSIRLAIQQVDDHPLEDFAMKMGIGKVIGPRNSSKAHWKPVYQYTVTGFADVQYVVASLWNWLSPRRQTQAAKALKDWQKWELVNVKRG